MAVHVFVDNSNVFLGSHRASEVREKHIPSYAVRVFYRQLFALVEGARDVSTRVLAGSVPPGNDDLWENARTCGYSTDLLRRVESDEGGSQEQAVDEVLHLKIAMAVLYHAPPQTLVLVTGDGKESAYGTSFPELAERALAHDWEVEVWSWRQSLSPKFARMVEDYEGISVHELDRYYPEITFVRAGSYKRPSGGVVHVAERRARVADLRNPAALGRG